MAEKTQRPTQAVILAGGRGSRLRALTESIPKPMVFFHGKPFLTHLLEMLRDQGFRRILILTGYRGEIIRNHYGNGHALGLKIDYSHTSPENETGRRLALVKERLDPVFFLLYCDNYWPMRFDDMWAKFKASGLPAIITVYANEDDYTRSNVRIDKHGLLTDYDRYRKKQGLQGVEICYAILKKSVLKYLPANKNAVFQSHVYPQLIKRKQLLTHLTHHRYYSVGSLERLTLTDAFLQPQKAIILDRDGVLNKKAPKAQYVKTWKDFKWLPGSVKALQLLKSAGYRLIVVSNQAGVARQQMTLDDLQMIHACMQNDLRMVSASVDSIYTCTHGWDDGCFCRKPRPGMLFQAQREFHLNLLKTPFIGDDERDLEAGKAAGCPTYLVNHRFNFYRWAQRFLINKLQRNADAHELPGMQWPLPHSQ